MSSRSLILNKIKNTNVVEEVALPEIENFGEKYKSKIVKFQEMLKSVGGEGIVSKKNLNTIIKNLYPDAVNIYSNVDECELGNVNMADIKNPNELKDLDLAIVKGEFAVAENGAVWINNIDEIHRVTYFITQSLVIVINKDEVVNNMHEAYERIDFENISYGSFISGPSKTADIEQSLVIGAHGPKSSYVIFV